MFIDTKEPSKVGVIELRRKTEAPTLRALSDLLKNPERWPPGFEWDFRRCQTCAMGLAIRVWPEHFTERNHILWIGTVFELSLETVEEIFCEGFFGGWFPQSWVTPQIVAWRIDRHLAGWPI